MIALLVLLTLAQPKEPESIGRDCPRCCGIGFTADACEWLNSWNGAGVNIDWGYHAFQGGNSVYTFWRVDNLNDHQVWVCFGIDVSGPGIVEYGPAALGRPHVAMWGPPPNCVHLPKRSAKGGLGPAFVGFTPKGGAFVVSKASINFVIPDAVVCRWGVDFAAHDCMHDPDADAALERARGLRLDKMLQLFIESAPRVPVKQEVAQRKKACLRGDQKACDELKR